MSSSDSKFVFPSITECSTVPELMSFLRSSFRPQDYKEVEIFLTSREEDMKMELRNQKSDNESMKKERDLAESLQGLSELKKLEVEEELKKCNEKMNGLYEERKVLIDREKRAEEAAEQLNKAEIQSKKGILELSKQNEQLTMALGGAVKEKNLVIEELEKCKEKIAEDQKVLNDRERRAEEAVEKLNKAGIVSRKRILELCRQNEELTMAVAGAVKEKNLVIEELNKCKEKMAGLYEDQRVLSDREKRAEEAAEKLNKVVKEKNLVIEGLKRAVDEAEIEKKKMIEELTKELDQAVMEKNKMNEELMNERQAAQETAELHGQKFDEYEARVSHLVEVFARMLDVDISDFRSGSYTLDNLVNGIGEVLMPSRSHSVFSSTKTQSTHLAKEASGTSDHMQTAEGAIKQHDNLQASSAAQSACNSHRAENSAADKYSNESPAAGSNDRKLQNEEGSMNCQNDTLPIAQAASDSPEDQRNSIGQEKGNDDLQAADLQQRKKRSLSAIDDSDNSPVCRQKLNDSGQQFVIDVSSGNSSSDSEDESSTDSHQMDILVADLRKDTEKTWMSAAEMLSAFEEDGELCLNAICALYRTKISAKKSISNSSSPANLGFFHFDAVRGNELAEFLINGDQEHRQKRSLSEVQQNNRDVLKKCKDLASQYYEKLFEIYVKKEDPLFRPR